MKQWYRIATDRWYIQRTVYLVGGLFVALGTALGLWVHPHWHYFVLFVGVMFMNFALSGYCPMAILLDKLGIPRR